MSSTEDEPARKHKPRSSLAALGDLISSSTSPRTTGETEDDVVAELSIEERQKVREAERAAREKKWQEETEEREKREAARREARRLRREAEAAESKAREEVSAGATGMAVTAV